MSESMEKHLALIQGVINRLAQNSFAYKGWAITLVAAIFALSAKESNPQFLSIALLPTLAFWGLDAYYLRQERLFRKLYDGIRAMKDGEWSQNPYSMDTSPYRGQVASWWRTCLSKTIRWLYLPLILVVLAVTTLSFAFN